MGDCVPFCVDFIGEEFSSFTSAWHQPVGIICGSALGLITVWFAASSPARRAAKASPITAATGNAVENAADSPCHARLFGSRAELSLGVSHATSSKKNLLLMTGSFALSILLFFELFGFASMGWICAESVAVLRTGLIGG